MCLAIPGQVVELTDTEKHLARVTVAGIHRVVNVALLQSPDLNSPGPRTEGPRPNRGPRSHPDPPPDANPRRADPESSGSRAATHDPEPGVQPGDWVLIHVGFAISRIDEEEARRTYEFLEELGADFEEELDDFSESEIA